MASGAGSATYHLVPQDHRGLVLLDVQGSLTDASVVGWHRVLRGALLTDRQHIALDLRGCRDIEPHCLRALLAAGAASKAAGRQMGVVTFPGSRVERLIQVYDGELARYVTVRELMSPQP